MQNHKNKANTFIGIAFLIGIVASVLIEGILATIIMFTTLPLWILGCYHYAIGKGYNGKWGLLGILPILGLIILIFFPDKNK